MTQTTDRVRGFQQQYDTMMDDLAQVESLLTRLEKIEQSSSTLLEYYHGEWIEDHTNPPHDDKRLAGSDILSEDTLWDAFEYHKNLKIRILQYVAKHL